MKWNEIIYINVKNYAKLNGFNIGDIEESLKKPRGYFSRVAKNGNMRVSDVFELAAYEGAHSVSEWLNDDIFKPELDSIKKLQIQEQISRLTKELNSL